MADCSKTEVYISESKRMCDYYSDNNLGSCCEDCPFYPSFCLTTPRMKPEHAKEAINRVQKWSDEHPEPKPKTYADVFFEEHPKAGRSYLTKEDFQNGAAFPTAKRCHIYGIGAGCCMEDTCSKAAQKKCWNEPYKEDAET